MNKRLLIFHPTIAPYRIDFFNDLSKAFKTQICLEYRNLKDQKFDYEKIESQFAFDPVYLENSNEKGIWEQIDKFTPDLVVVSEYGKIALMVLAHKFFKRRKYKVVSLCDDSYDMVAGGNDFTLLHKISRCIMVPFIDDLVLVDSRATDWYREHYGKGLYFPIIKSEETTIRDYQRILPKSLSVAHKYKLFGKKILLFVGRLVALKNVDSAIRAFANINQKDSVFVIVGDGPEKDRLMTLSKELGTNTLFTGRLEGDELNVWYNIAQVFILPSYKEAFGAVTNEALLAGCVSIVSEKAGSQSLIISGKNGDVFPPMDINAITCKIRYAFENVKTLDNIVLKENLMQISYTEFMNGLIMSLNKMI